MCWIRAAFGGRPGGFQPVWRGRLGVARHYTTHPQQTHGWWENTTCLCWQKQASLPTRRQARCTSVRKKTEKRKKPSLERWMPFASNYDYTLNNVLNTGVIFLNNGFCIKQTRHSMCTTRFSIFMCCNKLHWLHFRKQNTFYIFFRTSCSEVIQESWSLKAHCRNEHCNLHPKMLEEI